MGTEVEVDGKYPASALMLKFHPWHMNYDQENIEINSGVQK